MNTLAEIMSHQINPKPYHTKLSSTHITPPKSYKDAQGREVQWFEAFRKEKDGLLKFNTVLIKPRSPHRCVNTRCVHTSSTT
jgi:hypothetical protein